MSGTAATPEKTSPAPAIDWQAQLRTEDGGQVWPFVEDEDGNITGYGQQDATEFAAAANRYDEQFHGSALPVDEQWSAKDVRHVQVLPKQAPSGDWLLLPVHGETPAGTFWVTALWSYQ